MTRFKSFPQKITDFAPLLQDIRNNLGRNYMYYKECIVAISCTDARREGTSAWFEHMTRLVEGIDEVVFSHAGVQFLLREMAYGESEFLASPQSYTLFILKLHLAPLVNTMPPPLLPRHIQSTQLPTMNAHTPIKAPKASDPAALSKPPRSPFVFPAPPTPAYAPIPLPFEASQMKARMPVPTGLQNPKYDPMLFTNPGFKRDVNAFWGHPDGSGHIADYSNGPPNPLTASDRDLAALIPRYNPADDDLQIFRETAARAAAARGKEARLEIERVQMIKDF
jgi:hypothetical protein